MINIFVDNYFDKKDAITVKELIEALCTYPLHEKVYAEWEGLTVPILKENIEVKQPTERS